VWISPSLHREPHYLTLNPWGSMPFLGAGSAQFPLIAPLMFVTLGVSAFAVTSWLMDRKLNL